MRDEEPRRVRETIEPLAARLGLGGALETGVVWGRWAEIVGAGMAEHAEPTSLRSGVLRIRTDSSAWATEIGYLGEEIRRRINAEVGSEAVREVRVWTGPGKPAARPPAPPSEVQSGSSDAGEDLEPPAALERARSAWQARRGGDRRV